MTAVRTNDSTVGLDYDEYQVDEDVTFCVTFVKDNCTKMNCTTEKCKYVGHVHRMRATLLILTAFFSVPMQ